MVKNFNYIVTILVEVLFSYRKVSKISKRYIMLLRCFKTGTYFQLNCSTTAGVFSVVYKFDCLRDANCSCIGMTTRHFATRTHEHLYSTITKTAITEHLKVCNGCKKNSIINSLNIIKKCSTEYKTKIHEALQIKISPQLNKQLNANGFLFFLKVF